MMNGNKKPATRLNVNEAMLEMKKMQAELAEHRYNLEQHVEKRTEQLLKRISLLESCNATLCDKLAAAQKELIAFKQLQAAPTVSKKDTEQINRAVQIYGMNDLAQKRIGLSVQ